MHPFDGTPTVSVEGRLFVWETAFEDYVSDDGYIEVYRDQGRWLATDYRHPAKPVFDLSTESGWGDFRAHLRALAVAR